MYYASKRNTVNNVDNIEDLAVCYDTPEDMLIVKEEGEQVDKFDRKEFIEIILKSSNFSDLDIEVLMGFTPRRLAAAKLNISYAAYRARLRRSINRISEEDYMVGVYLKRLLIDLMN